MVPQTSREVWLGRSRDSPAPIEPEPRTTTLSVEFRPDVRLPTAARIASSMSPPV
ncbi:hypothetical protein [Streptomonospora halophila]